jgi:crotonobetainyl-CoA:carnitine CoA-transferase CaiB-like acyl-CoA transferase
LSELDFSGRVAREAEIDAVLTVWAAAMNASEAAAAALRAGVPAAALASSTDLVASSHLLARGFWEVCGERMLPGLPWRASFGRANGPAPALGADTEAVLREIALSVTR